MELAFEILCEAGQCWSCQEESVSCIGIVGDLSKNTMGLHESVELFACVVSTTKGMVLFVTEMLPSSGSFHVTG